MANPHELDLADSIGGHVREERAALGWTQQQLADAMQALGYDWKQITVAEVEGKRRRGASVAELLGLAIIFGKSVAELIKAPPTYKNGQVQKVALTSFLALEAGDLRSIIQRGHPLPTDKILNMRRDRLEEHRQEHESLLSRGEELSAEMRETYARAMELGDTIQKLEAEIGRFDGLTDRQILDIDEWTGNELERDIAKRLNVAPHAVGVAAFKMWGTSATDEHARRVEAGRGSVSARRKQATIEIQSQVKTFIETNGVPADPDWKYPEDGPVMMNANYRRMPRT